jgi:DNA-binding MarR family transcriptional regulator
MQQSPAARLPLSEVRAFRALTRVLERQLARSLGEQTSCCGVSLAQCHCLLEVEERVGPTVGELAAALDVDGSTMSRNLDGMVAASLVERTPNPDDRRSVVVRLSAAGRRTVEEINRRNDAFYALLLGGLSVDERRRVTEGTQILARAMREHAQTKGD